MNEQTNERTGGEVLLSLRDVSKAFDGVKAMDGVSFDVRRGEIVGLIGPNGAGKTTAFNVITGLLKADGGKIHFKEHEITALSPHRIARLGIGRTFQDNRLFKQMSAVENVMLGLKYDGGETIGAALLRSKRMVREEAENKQKALELLRSAGLFEKQNEQGGNLSLGQRRLLELARVQATEAELLLLDEPTAGLFPSKVEEFKETIRSIRRSGRTVLLIEHNMRVVMEVSDRVVVLDYGKKIADGTPEEIQKDERVLEAYLGRRKRLVA